MIYALFILFGITLFQDVKYRGVHWSVFPMLLAGTAFYREEQINLLDMSYNLVFLIVLMLSLTLYLSLRQGKLVNITKGFFSWGDILFLLAIIPLFTLRDYMLFFIIGTFASLIFHLIASIISIQKTIPYAGYMALVSIMFLIFQQQIAYLTQVF